MWKLLKLIAIPMACIALGMIIGSFLSTYDFGDNAESEMTFFPYTPEMRDSDMDFFYKKLNENRTRNRFSPLIVECYDDKKRFSVFFENQSYVIASELYTGQSEDDQEITRSYIFKEGGEDILFTIARNSKTNKLKNILYSYGNSISYFDKDGDGIWDVLRGIPPQCLTTSGPAQLKPPGEASKPEEK